MSPATCASPTPPESTDSSGHSRSAAPLPPDEPPMDTPTSMTTSGPRTVRAPRGTTLHCRNWLAEAAYRMLQNNLDPDVAERPDDLVVYGGIGKAARNWDCFDRILESLRTLEDDETLLIQSGK